MKDLESWIKEIKETPIVEVESLDLSTLWNSNDTWIWKANSTSNPSLFYPVFKYQDYYSPNVLPLILLKDSFKKNNQFWDSFKPKRSYQSGLQTVDQEITRVSGAFQSDYSIQSKKDMIEKVSEAMMKDIATYEQKYPDHEHVVFCGGRDSLNILLLPWSKPIIVASAPPNFIHVKQFIENNKIAVKELIELNEEPSEHEDIEVLANNCLNNLTHCRWINQFISIAEKYPKSIFWKGQLGDTFLTENWKSYRVKRKKWYQKFGGLKKTQSDFIKALWNRGAMWQAMHVAQLRLATGNLVLSVYHGDEMSKVLKSMDLIASVQSDIREEIGNYIFGKQVIYPSDNPSPEKLVRDPQLSSPDHFQETLSKVLTNNS